MASIHTSFSISQFSTLSTRQSRSSNYTPTTRISCSVAGAVAEPKAVGAVEPLLLSAVRGDDVERPPVWLMRQAGRYMKVYDSKFISKAETIQRMKLLVLNTLKWRMELLLLSTSNKHREWSHFLV